jgi:hypothetical protein
VGFEPTTVPLLAQRLNPTNISTVMFWVGPSVNRTALWSECDRKLTWPHEEAEYLLLVQNVRSGEFPLLDVSWNVGGATIVCFYCVATVRPDLPRYFRNSAYSVSTWSLLQTNFATSPVLSRLLYLEGCILKVMLSGRRYCVVDQPWPPCQSQSHIATDGQSVCLGVEPNYGTFDHRLLFFIFFYFFWKLQSCHFGCALSDERSGLSCVSLVIEVNSSLTFVQASSQCLIYFFIKLGVPSIIRIIKSSGCIDPGFFFNSTLVGGEWSAAFPSRLNSK